MEERARRAERRARFALPCSVSTTPRAFRIQADGAWLRRLRVIPTAISASAIAMTSQIGKPVNGSVPLPIAPVAASTPAPWACPRCGLTTGLGLPGVLGVSGVLGFADGGLDGTFGPCPGSPGL